VRCQVFNIALARALPQNEIAHWFKVFWSDELVLNAFTYCHFEVQELLQGVLPIAAKRRMLAQSVRVTNLLNERLTRFAANETGDGEALLLAMCYIHKPPDEDSLTEVDDGNADQAQGMLYVPHVRYDEGFDFTRLRQFKGLMAAINFILGRIGGLSTIEDRALRSAVAGYVIPHRQLITDQLSAWLDLHSVHILTNNPWFQKRSYCSKPCLHPADTRERLAAFVTSTLSISRSSATRSTRLWL
jgi:hypothetical protein